MTSVTAQVFTLQLAVRWRETSTFVRAIAVVVVGEEIEKVRWTLGGGSGCSSRGVYGFQLRLNLRSKHHVSVNKTKFKTKYISPHQHPSSSSYPLLSSVEQIRVSPAQVEL
jgi:hypothetical protein